MNRHKLNQKNLIIVSGLIIILILGFLIVINFRKNTPEGAEVKNDVSVKAPGGQSALPIVTPSSTANATFRDPVPANITVPETNTILTAEQAKIIAVPTIVAPAAEQSIARYRSFDIKGEGGIFTPSEIIANFRDRVHINLTAVDKDYDFVFPSYSMMITVKKGETKPIEFEAVFDGSFNFYCNSCGGLNSSARGKIIIVK